MSDHRNARLRAAREAIPSRMYPGAVLQRAELADLVNEYVRLHFGVQSGMDRKYIQKLEAGRVSWPNTRYRQALRDILGASSDADLGFVCAQLIRVATPTTADLQLPWTVDGTVAAITAVAEDDPMRRRSFLKFTSAALSKLALDWLVALPAGSAARPRGQQVTHAQVDSLDLVTDDLRRMDDRLGGGAVILLARSQVQAVSRLLREGCYDDSVGKRLHGSAAELLRFCGWNSWDLGNYGDAQRYWGAALRAAHVAGDNQIGANIMAFWACQLLEGGDHRDALNLSGAARLRLNGSPKVTAIVNLSHAEAAGAAGAERECRNAIEAAHHSLDQPDPTDPSWAYWVDANFHEMAGFALVQLGDLRSGIEHLNTFVDATGPGREQARGHAFLARAYADMAEPEMAATTGVAAIDLLEGDVLSPRSVQQLHVVRDALVPYRSHPGVDEFNQRLLQLT